MPSLSSHVVPAIARARIRISTHHLPAVLTDQIYIECRLAGAASRVDLQMRIDRVGARILADRNETATLDRALHSRSVWRQLAGLAGCWLDEQTMGDAIRALWLEFDLPDHDWSGGLPRPRFFVELETVLGGHRIGRAGRGFLSAQVSRRFAAPARRASPRGRPRPLAGIRAPPGHRLRPRPTNVAAALVPLRAALGDLASSDPDLDPELVRHAPATPIVTHLDVNETILPGVGIELTFERRPQVRGELRERGFLDHLVQAGLCTPEAGRSARPGHSMARLNHQIWPSLVLRRLNHVKLRFEARRLAEAKAYLCFTHWFCTPACRPGAQ